MTRKRAKIKVKGHLARKPDCKQTDEHDRLPYFANAEGNYTAVTRRGGIAKVARLGRRFFGGVSCRQLRRRR